MAGSPPPSQISLSEKEPGHWDRHLACKAVGTQEENPNTALGNQGRYLEDLLRRDNTV